MSVTRRDVSRWFAALPLFLFSATTAAAHVSPAALEVYGPFPPRAAHCQRAIARASSRCLTGALAARGACLAAPLDGSVCNAAEMEASIAAARQNARASIADTCSAADAFLLGFQDLDEARVHAGNVCDELAAAATSAAYAPLLGGSSLDEASRRCVKTTARALALLLRAAARSEQHALDRIARADLPAAAKFAQMAKVRTRIERARMTLERRVDTACGASFATLYGREANALLSSIAQRSYCFAAATYAQAEMTCPAPICGNGVQEPGEQCDDGNGVDGDSCRDDCTTSTCQTFDSTFALLQKAIFENHGCTDSLCHGTARQGGMDLRTDAAYASLVGHEAQIAPGMLRVAPASAATSLLYLKLAARTAGDPAPAALPGSPMPIGGNPLSSAELEALRLWIHGGAPELGVVDGTSQLLNACLPPPDPLKVPPPAPPAAGTGVQFAMPTLPMAPHSEHDLCIASYYDLSAPGAVPAELLTDCVGQFPGTNDVGVNAGKCFRYNTQELTQDPQGHHLWEMIYSGSAGYGDPGWGGWHCSDGANDGLVCDPADADACPGGICGSASRPGGPCTPGNFGPQEFNQGFVGLALSPVSRTTFPDGVFSVLPLKGIVIWDSHAYNLTSQPTRMAAWGNHEFAVDALYPARFLFDVEFLYTQDVPPFATREYCATFTFPEGVRAFSFRAHYHKRGKRFRMWLPPQTPCGNGGAAPVRNALRTDPNCAPGEPAALFYQSVQYNEPVHYAPDPPLVFSGSVEQRTIRFCGLYDNGATNPAEVKRASTSPLPFVAGDPGGPCAAVDRACVGGVNKGQACGGNDALCPDSSCDACPLRGGVTTDDEMFGIQVFYYDTEK